MATPDLIYLTIDDGSSTKREETIRVSAEMQLEEVRSAFYAAANLSSSSTNSVLKLYRKDGVLLPIGPNTPRNSKEDRYILKSRTGNEGVDALNAVSDLLGQITAIKEKVDAMKRSISEVPDGHGAKHNPDELTPPNLLARRRPTLPSLPPQRTFTRDVTEHLKHPTFDVWQWQDDEMVDLLAHMFTELGLMTEFKLDEETLRRFLQCVKGSYNTNPFHNFRHCFCVAQMMYGILHVTNLHAQLQPLEKLVLLISCIGHDLDHPGFNNAYQVNASTELGLIYNDISPLENHHAAVLFTILKESDTNILRSLPANDYREARKQIIACVLATDMAKHGELMGRFKAGAEREGGYDMTDPAARSLLLQMVIKCADISNEVRPKHVSEPWVDNLLEEFFAQSDREKAEGLPFAPFMDRQKVTKASAQVGFIQFVLIPLFELVAKVLPNMEEPIIQPIRSALQYYKTLA
ncbi:uncharacterized protein EV422DRAFT_331632 [Fimicolochytrium jonesii]|uniref:uncharacterized protein n=1 Tax=Fimicolochytrium jonesii TaxID=1396493 RepID=UPI0022FF13D7|nr:uncharacterized protein EV422DRAFT_331632 [Fimicolochytrium jonesii]KAI8816058.1 hypothetical protein EV422DRAFT_331632 [Fimicolochytrium jonesii]